MSATWSRSSRAPPRVPGVTPFSGVVIVGVGPPLHPHWRADARRGDGIGAEVVMEQPRPFDAARR